MHPSVHHRPSPSRRAFARGALLVLAAVACGPASAADPATCAARSVPTDSQVVTCTFGPSTVRRSVRFVAQFVGSHDDTRLALTATLDGKPLECEAGSTTSLSAEDGQVSLVCRFAVEPAASSPLLEVALSVHHAQYLSASVVAE